MDINELIRVRKELRAEWDTVRRERLKHRDALMLDGLTITMIRRDKEYRRLKKEQKSASKMIKHNENRILREIRR